VPALC